MRSTSQTGHTFSQVPQANIPRSTFSRSHGFKTTFNADYLIPFFVDEVLPGDTFAVSATMFARMSTPFVPLMDNLFLETFYFFVPHRLVWTHFQNFMGEEEAPGDVVNSVVSYLTPVVTTPGGGFTNGSIADYFGIPTQVSNLNGTGSGPLALPFRAYNLIWNEWFRDENLQTKATVDKGDGPDLATNYPLRKRNKRHDYFTSALPWPQKGPGVSIPLGTTAPVNFTVDLNGPKFLTQGAGATVTPSRINYVTQASTGQRALQLNQDTSVTAGQTANLYFAGGASTNLGFSAVTDLSAATAATINTLRQAFQIQRLYERDARGGTRYTELVRSHFGVISPDARLQRPEYLGGSSQRININAVAQTSATAAGQTELGHLAAIGTTAGRSGFTKSFTEHGTILGLMQVRADQTYQYGLNKMWSRRTKVDFYWPALAHLGEQAILNQELYATGTAGTGAAQDQGVFGYQERWAEYRYYPSLITGQFRSNYATPLDVWHLAEKNAALPALNSTFIASNTDMARVLAVTSAPHFLLDSFIECRATRPMPVYSVPGLIDHF